MEKHLRERTRGLEVGVGWVKSTGRRKKPILQGTEPREN